MLPNHPPLVIAEQFGTLESLFPGRIDLGVGVVGREAEPRAVAHRLEHRLLDLDVEGVAELVWLGLIRALVAEPALLDWRRHWPKRSRPDMI
mgnify:CR=1 FL=1